MNEDELDLTDININNIKFGPITRYAHAFCTMCDFDIEPTAWLDPDNGITEQYCIDIYQQAHDGGETFTDKRTGEKIIIPRNDCQMEITVNWTDPEPED